ncbi:MULTISPECIES: hypothetical protein [Cupriavidus]
MTTPIYYGTIRAAAADHELLASFGITLAEHDATAGEFLARADADALARLAEFTHDFPHTMHLRPVNAGDMQLRPGMTVEDLRAEAAFVAFRLATDGSAHARRWRMAAGAVQAMTASLDTALDPASMRLSGNAVTSLMRLNGQTIATLAQAMGVTQTRVRDVREQGVSGEGYVLDWLEALHASEDADAAQNRELAGFIALLQQGAQRQASGEGSRLTDGSRIDAMHVRQMTFADAICTAKAADFERCGHDMTARLALMRKPDAVLLTDAMVREWAWLEGDEFLALEDPLKREDAACALMDAMTSNPDLCAVINHDLQHVAALVRAHAETAAHRSAHREARKQGLSWPERPAARPFAEYTVLTRTGGDRRHVATFSDAAHAFAAFRAAPATARPYLLANGEMVFYRDPQRGHIAMTATCRPALRQAYAQRKDDSDAAMSHALQEGLRRTELVLYSPEDGVFLGECLGLGFWSKLETGDQPSAATFESVADAKQYLSTWQSPPPTDLQFVWVQPEAKGPHASMEACVRAGLPRWEISLHAYEDVSPTVH